MKRLRHRAVSICIRRPSGARLMLTQIPLCLPIMFGCGITKIYECIKTARSRTVEKVAKWRTCQNARLCARFTRAHRAR